MAARTFTHLELEQAFKARRGDTWPTDLDEAMHDPAYRGLIQVEARRRAMRAATPAPRGQQPQAAHRAPALPTITPPAALDFKRRASGERDDD